MKRRTTHALKPKLRDRRSGRSPYAKHNKRPYKYLTVKRLDGEEYGS